jgi:predicted oxidoreductase
VKTQKLGKSDLTVTRLAHGCMRSVGTWDPNAVTAEKKAAAHAAYRAALEAGITLFDHADIYARGACETAFGEWLHQSPGVRDRIVIATKCGIRFPGEPQTDSPHRYDFSARHIIWSAEQSLKRLQTNYIDLYQLHRPDLLMDPAEIAGAFGELRQQGKVRHFGVSNFTPSFVTALQASLPFPLIVNQVEISLGRLACFYDGTLDQCLAEKITPLAWSPVAKGLVATGGKVPDNHPKREAMIQLQQTMDQIATRLGVSRTVLALAWLLKHPAKIVPIVGSANPAHIKEAVKADDVDLGREDWYRLLVAARGERLP